MASSPTRSHTSRPSAATTFVAHGGATFAQALSRHGLVDEYVEATTFATGSAFHVYQRRTMG